MAVNSNPDNFIYGTVVQYTCLDGYRFDTEVYALNVTCAEDENWRPQIGDCRGKSRVLQENNYIIHFTRSGILRLINAPNDKKQKQQEVTH